MLSQASGGWNGACEKGKLMYPVFGNKDFAEQVLRCIETNQPIVPRGEWTVRDMIFVAGALRFVAMSRGPVRIVKEGDGFRLAKRGESTGLSAERQEALEVQFEEELSLAIEFASQLAMKAKDGVWDECLEPEVLAAVGTKDGGKVVHFLQGAK